VSFTSSTGGTTEFVYDTTAGIPAVTEEETPSGSIYYIREPDGSLIARVEGSVTQYYHFDDLGSTRLLTNGSGTVTDTYRYDAWGKQTAHTGSTAQPYQYVGALGYYADADDNHGLLLLGARYYNPSVGRFITLDPARDGRSWYVYVGANPVTRVDPAGLDAADLPVCSRTDWRKNCTGCNGKFLEDCIENPDISTLTCRWISTLCEEACTGTVGEEVTKQMKAVRCCWRVAQLLWANGVRKKAEIADEVIKECFTDKDEEKDKKKC